MPPRVTEGPTVNGVTTLIIGDGPSHTPAQAQFESLIDTVRAHPDQLDANIGAINKAIQTADGRFYQALDEVAAAQRAPGYLKAVRDIDTGYDEARAALTQIPSDKRSQAVRDAQSYVGHPTDKLRASLLSYQPSGKDLFAGVDKVAAAVGSPDYIKGETIRQQTEESMIDSLAFRDLYGRLLANDLGKFGPALGVIADRAHMLGEMAAGKRLAPGE
jgi:hypothetical protein